MSFYASESDTLQTTVQNTVECSGIGLHSGSVVRMRILPAPEGTGIVFKRVDVDRNVCLVPARYDLVADTRLGTTLRNKFGVSVATVEHLMAALWGMGIDNAIIELDAPEVPIMDGSSEPFLALLKEAGVRALSAPRVYLRVIRPVEVREGESLARVEPLLADEEGMVLDVTIDFDHAVVGRSRAVYDFSEVTFNDTMADARTFGFEHEVAQLRSCGLALGGSLENAIVVGRDRVLNEEGLRHDDEFLRHKALDCVGDLFLARHRLLGRFTFLRPGHAVNNALLRALYAQADAYVLGIAEPRTVQPVVQPRLAVGAYF